MPHTGTPVRLADFTVRLFLPDALLADEERLNQIVWALNNLNLKNRLTKLLRYELVTRPVFAAAGVSPHFGGVQMTWTGEPQTRTESEPQFKQVELKAWELSGSAVVS